MSDEKPEYEVGYGCPPREKQFQSGRSGNPAGRPKGRKNIATIFGDVTDELIHVTENGRQKTVSKLEAIMRKLIAQALSGDFKAMKEIMLLHRLFDELATKETIEKPDREKDDIVMRRIMRRMVGVQSTAFEESTAHPAIEGQMIDQPEENSSEPAE
jgi:hypothetical protein